MADNMLESTPEGRAMSAAKEAMPLVEEGQALMDETMAGVGPTGTYSSARLASAAKLINRFAGIVEAPVSVPTAQDAIKNGPMPMDLVKGLMGIKSAVDAFAQAAPEEVTVEIPEISALVSDKDVALAVAQLGKILDSKDFQRFLRMEEPTTSLDEDAAVEEVIAPEDEAVIAPADDEELAILDMIGG
mgnify:FL=1